MACAKSYRSVLHFSVSLLSYSLVDNTVCKFRPLILIILGTEFFCFVSSIRFLSESVFPFNHFLEKLQQTLFSVVVPALGLISV